MCFYFFCDAYMKNLILSIIFALSVIHSSNSAEERFPREKQKFSVEEDQKLINIVKTYGENNWEKIAKLMPNRNHRQCRDRWNFYLNPNLNKGEWTNEEIDILKKQHKSFGNKWKKMSYFLPGRSTVEIRNKAIKITKEQPKIEYPENIVPLLEYLGDQSYDYEEKEFFSQNIIFDDKNPFDDQIF